MFFLFDLEKESWKTPSSISDIPQDRRTPISENRRSHPESIGSKRRWQRRRSVPRLMRSFKRASSWAKIGRQLLCFGHTWLPKNACTQMEPWKVGTWPKTCVTPAVSLSPSSAPLCPARAHLAVAARPGSKGDSVRPRGSLLPEWRISAARCAPENFKCGRPKLELMGHLTPSRQGGHPSSGDQLSPRFQQALDLRNLRPRGSRGRVRPAQRHQSRLDPSSHARKKPKPSTKSSQDAPLGAAAGFPAPSWSQGNLPFL